MYIHTSGARSQTLGVHLAPLADCDGHSLASLLMLLACPGLWLHLSAPFIQLALHLFHLLVLCLCSHVSLLLPLLRRSLFCISPQRISPSQLFSNLPTPPCLPSLFSSVSISLPCLYSATFSLASPLYFCLPYLCGPCLPPALEGPM